MIEASGVLVEGFEIAYGYDGVKILGNGDNGDNVIQSNYIHDSCNQGVLVVNSSGNQIVGNIIKDNGYTLYDHGIYFNLTAEATSDSVANDAIGNWVEGHPGFAIQWNGDDNISGAYVHIRSKFENNVVVNNGAGIILFKGVQQTVIRNNTIAQTVPSPLLDSREYLMEIWTSSIAPTEDNRIYNNIFYSSDAVMKSLAVIYENDSAQFNNNLCFVQNEYWKWPDCPSGECSAEAGNGLYDLYEPLDPTSLFGAIAYPNFVDEENYDFRPRLTSPAIGTADSSSLPMYDYEGQPRDCPVIGAFTRLCSLRVFGRWRK